MKIEIGDKEYNVEVARTEEEKIKGLQEKESLGENEGMLFIYDEPQELAFWMKDTAIPLDIVFIDEDGEVISVQQGQPYDETLLEEDGVMYVLEVNQNSGIQPGDELDIEEDDDDKQPVMKVLAPDGSTQMELEGGERIFSRKNTKTLIKMAKRAYSSELDKDYKALGKKVFKYLHIQDTNTPEYVDTPKSKED
mgnify:FL=1|jgi:uncharacterized membrane protein (UPF0127 family)|nr:MAG TPA: hypothetical protein [Bacteriophage sp.]DAR18760.1 MAG TPA: hypothetical protein [Caudoviricetes sp.]